MGINLPADVWLAPGNAGAAAAVAALAALAVASVRRRAFRRRSRTASTVLTPVPTNHVVPAPPLSESPLLEGTYRNRGVHMAYGVEGVLFITLALANRAPRGLEIGAGASSESAPFSVFNRTRLERLPAPWSLAIRGKRLWLSVGGDAHDPLLLRRRLELACDLADDWERVEVEGRG